MSEGTDGELTPQAHDVLAAARGVPCAPDQAAIERMNHAVLLATGAIGAAGVASAAGATAGKAGVTALGAKLIIVSCVTVLAVSGGVVAFSLSRSGEGRGEGNVLVAAPQIETPRAETPRAETPQAETPQAETPRDEATPTETPLKTPPAEQPADLPPRDALPAVSSPTRGSKAAVPKPTPELTPEVAAPNDVYARELALLEEASTKLQARDWNGVLSSIAAHDTEFPSGTLRAEAEVLRIISLCEVKRVTEATERSKQLQRTAGRSPALLRLAGSCVEP